MSDHPSVELIALDGEVVEIDEKLAPLIKELRRAGIDTVSCCKNAGEDLASLPDRLPHMTACVEFVAGYAYVDFFQRR